MLLEILAVPGDWELSRGTPPSLGQADAGVVPVRSGVSRPLARRGVSLQPPGVARSGRDHATAEIGSWDGT